MSGQIPPLHTIIIKIVQKRPAEYISEGGISRALRLQDALLNRSSSSAGAGGGGPPSSGSSSGSSSGVVARSSSSSKGGAAVRVFKRVDFVQELISYVTVVGRMTDEIFPVTSSSGFNDSRTSIILRNTKVTGKFVQAIVARCPNLQVVDLSGTLQVDDDTIEFILSNCKNIKQVLVQNCRKMTNRLLQLIKDYNTSSIEALDIGGDVNITISGIENFVSTYPFSKSITKLNVSGIIASDRVLNQVASKCTSLTSFGIGYGDISETALVAFLKARGSLIKYLNISWLGTTPGALYSQLSIEMLLDTLITHCPVLTELDLCGLKSVTLQHLTHIIESRFQRQTVDPSVKGYTTISCKFIGTAKAQIDTILALSYPSIKFIS